METVGSKYLETKTLSDTQIAKLIRNDIKTAVKSGMLPKGLKVSVRKTGSSMHTTISVTIKACPGVAVISAAWAAHQVRSGYTTETFRYGGSVKMFTEKASELVDTLEHLREAYNRDNSDLMTDYFDVRYYGRVSFDGDLQDNAIKAAFSVAQHLEQVA